MRDNKVSKKAIWEGAISPDNDTPSIGSQMQAQPQMMFCYKCNNVIPGNSTFCPYCQIKLFTECPKCGTKYSSQYPACNNCGTNREEYLRAQRREQERKEAIERENRRKRLEEERRRKEAEAEKERQERLKKYEEKARYHKENAEIKKTKEYETTHSLVSKAFINANKEYDERYKKITIIFYSSLCAPFIPVIWLILGDEDNLKLYLTISGLLFIPMILLVILANIVNNNKATYIEKKALQYIYNKKDYDKEMITPDLIKMANYQGKISECCIIAYRKKHKLPINYKWHNLR